MTARARGLLNRTLTVESLVPLRLVDADGGAYELCSTCRQLMGAPVPELGMRINACDECREVYRRAEERNRCGCTDRFVCMSCYLNSQ